MSKRNESSAIKLVSNNMKGGALPLNKETKDLIKVKHPVGKAASEDTKLHGPLPTIENIIFDIINDSMVLEAAKITKGGSGPSRMDAGGWRQILVSRDYGDASNNLRKAIALLTKKIRIEEIEILLCYH